jgi:hypothetical protein
MSVQCQATTAVIRADPRCKLRTRARFPYCWIHTKKILHLHVKDSTLLDDAGNSIGKGLFTTVDIPAPVSKRDGDEVKIIEMTGPPKPLNHVDPDNQYLINAETHLIDMENPSDSSVGRYSNECHPADEEKKICKNNAETITFEEGVWLCAKEAISAGDEIMWDYGAFYWDDMEDRKHDAPEDRPGKKRKRDVEVSDYISRKKRKKPTREELREEKMRGEGKEEKEHKESSEEEQPQPKKKRKKRSGKDEASDAYIRRREAAARKAERQREQGLDDHQRRKQNQKRARQALNRALKKNWRAKRKR